MNSNTIVRMVSNGESRISSTEQYSYSEDNGCSVYGQDDGNSLNGGGGGSIDEGIIPDIAETMGTKIIPAQLNAAKSPVVGDVEETHPTESPHFG
jgi:hypothetical protein